MTDPLADALHRNARVEQVRDVPTDSLSGILRVANGANDPCLDPRVIRLIRFWRVLFRDPSLLILSRGPERSAEAQPTGRVIRKLFLGAKMRRFQRNRTKWYALVVCDVNCCSEMNCVGFTIHGVLPAVCRGKVAARPPLGNEDQRSTESNRAFRAAAESDALSAPRTPAAPGSFDAPSTLSRSRRVPVRACPLSDVHDPTRRTNKIHRMEPPDSCSRPTTGNWRLATVQHAASGSLRPTAIPCREGEPWHSLPMRPNLL